MREHDHDWKQLDAETVFCRICGIEPWQRDQLDVQCEVERRHIRTSFEHARRRLGLDVLER